VLRTLVFIQKQIPSKDGERWFSIRIMPYRTFDDRIDGLVITFVNISDNKRAEVKLNETEQIHRLLLNSSSDIIIQLSTDWKIREFNHEAEKFFGKKREDAVNQNFIHLFIPEPLKKKVEKDLNRQLNQMLEYKYKMKVIAAGGKMPVVEWNINSLLNNQKMPAGMIIINKKGFNLT